MLVAGYFFCWGERCNSVLLWSSSSVSWTTVVRRWWLILSFSFVSRIEILIMQAVPFRTSLNIPLDLTLINCWAIRCDLSLICGGVKCHKMEILVNMRTNEPLWPTDLAPLTTQWMDRREDHEQNVSVVPASCGPHVSRSQHNHAVVTECPPAIRS